VASQEEYRPEGVRPVMNLLLWACTSTMASGHGRLLWALGVIRVIEAGGNLNGNSDLTA
jgi:hypothetical protein